VRRPSALVASLAVIAVVALFFGPGLFAKHKVVGYSSESVYSAGFDLLDKYVPGLKLDRSDKRDSGVPREGGGQTAYRCVRIVKGGKGWACIALSPDGRAGIAAWVAAKPTPDNAQFLVGDRNALFRPRT
jgi:hypothetical protein